MIPDFYLVWTWQRNCNQSSLHFKLCENNPALFFPPSSLLEKPLSSSANCVFVSLSPAQTMCVPVSTHYQHVLSSCASQHNHAFQFTADRHDCPRLTCRQRETHPAHQGIQRFSSSSFLEVPPAFQSCSSLVETLRNNCNANSCHCQVGIVLECSNSCTYLRHLLQHWRQLIHDRIKPYNNPVSSLSFYNLVPSGA